MPCCGRLNGWIKIIETMHCPMKHVCIFLYKLHWFQFFQHCLFTYLIFCFATFFFKMPGICNVAYVSYFITKMHKVAIHDIERYKRSCMTKMTFAAYCWSAYIHAYMSGRYRLK